MAVMVAIGSLMVAVMEASIISVKSSFIELRGGDDDNDGCANGAGYYGCSGGNSCPMAVAALFGIKGKLGESLQSDRAESLLWKLRKARLQESGSFQQKTEWRI